MRVVTLKNGGLLGLHATDESGKVLRLSGITLRSMCSGKVTQGLRQALGVAFGEDIQIVNARRK